MARTRVHNLAVSIDGFAAGPDQAADAPLGVGGRALHDWVLRTRSGRRMFGEEGGETGVDDDFIARGTEGIGATVIGRNMFGPIRGGWGDGSWRGWWGDEPPYHHDVFVVTHHERESIPMAGGTTFHFVTDGPEAALERALAAAGGLDVRVGGGPNTIQQLLRAGLIDDLHVAIVPIILGAGERLLDQLDGAMDRYECVAVTSGSVAHVRFARRADD